MADKPRYPEHDWKPAGVDLPSNRQTAIHYYRCKRKGCKAFYSNKDQDWFRKIPKGCNGE